MELSNNSSLDSHTEYPTSYIRELLYNLSDGQLLMLRPRGCSMFPFFSGNRDTLFLKRCKQNPKKGDIVLYVRANGVHVVHRIHHIEKSEGRLRYYMLGDNQTEVEGPLESDCILGIVVKIKRKNRLISCSSFLYRFLSALWLFFLPVRPFLLRCIRSLRKAFHPKRSV